MSLGVFNPISDGYTSTSPSLGTERSPDPSSSSYASFSPLSLTSSSYASYLSRLRSGGPALSHI
ncbi:hypothetical protein GW17_00010033 [Ensete ventricosum]|nr:hypothetical protein GW17_00010033 [Ensete ventricosum]